jgi:hypothetical protein
VARDLVVRLERPADAVGEAVGGRTPADVRTRGDRVLGIQLESIEWPGH